MPHNTIIYRLLLLVLLFVLILVGIACVDFDIADKPSEYFWPVNETPTNCLGPVGAWVAYYVNYYLGAGVYMLLIGVGGVALAGIRGKRITQPVLRTVGLLLCVVSVSVFANYSAKLIPSPFPAGGGGVLGIVSLLTLGNNLPLVIGIGCTRSPTRLRNPS